MLDFYALRRDIKAILLRRWQQIDLADDPLVWAWAARALAVEGISNNPILGQALAQAKQWLESNAVWNNDSQIGNAGLLCDLVYKPGDESGQLMALNIVESVERMRQKTIAKFSKLNDPEFVFGVSLVDENQFTSDMRNWLRQHCEINAQPGNWRRSLLFAAASQELKGNLSPFAPNTSDLQIYEIFPALWFAERYPNLIDSDDRRRGLWEAFERVKDVISWEDTPGNTGPLYTASILDLAMLFEALVRRTNQIDPVILFNNLPLHPNIRQASESLFIKGEHLNAVFEAAKLFVDIVKHRTGNPNNSKTGMPLDGAPLMSHAFGGKGPLLPVLKFNNLKTQQEENEQRGLSMLAQGMVSAFRNPKGHLPKAAISLDPYEALEQLALISYLMKRLDTAHP